jgi:hypothetical protein
MVLSIMLQFCVRTVYTARTGMSSILLLQAFEAGKPQIPTGKTDFWKTEWGQPLTL